MSPIKPIANSKDTDGADGASGEATRRFASNLATLVILDSPIAQTSCQMTGSRSIGLFDGR